MLGFTFVLWLSHFAYIGVALAHTYTELRTVVMSTNHLGIPVRSESHCVVYSKAIQTLKIYKSNSILISLRHKRQFNSVANITKDGSHMIIRENC